MLTEEDVRRIVREEVASHTGESTLESMARSLVNAVQQQKLSDSRPAAAPINAHAQSVIDIAKAVRREVDRAAGPEKVLHPNDFEVVFNRTIDAMLQL